MWRCPRCETFNEDGKCIICAEARPIAKQNVVIPHTVPPDNRGTTFNWGEEVRPEHYIGGTSSARTWTKALVIILIILIALFAIFLVGNLIMEING